MYMYISKPHFKTINFGHERKGKERLANMSLWKHSVTAHNIATHSMNILSHCDLMHYYIQSTNTTEMIPFTVSKANYTD
jgi:hypothetical protein